MKLPHRFPDPLDEARERAKDFRQLTSTERWTEQAALVAFGWNMVASSPRRDLIELRMDEQEAESQRIQAELLRRHGR